MELQLGKICNTRRIMSRQTSGRLTVCVLGAIMVLLVLYNSYSTTIQEFRLNPDVPDPVDSTVADVKNSTPTSPTYTVDNKMILILFTEGRSGSTWLSSFFWAHPKVFYSFEPEYAILHNPECHNGSKSMRICNTELFNHLFKCDFHTYGRSILGKFPYGYHNSCPDCSTIPKLEAFCDTVTHIVPKMIWMKDLRDVEEVMSNQEFNIKVVHLVRDARPLIMSRTAGSFGTLDGVHNIDRTRDIPGYYTDKELFEQSGTLCERILRAAKLGDNPPQWFKGKYMRISHEQLTVRPVEIAKELYEFSHLPWTAEIEDYIYKTTIGEIGKTGQYGIGRVSATMTESWKKTIRPEWLPTITKACKPMLDYLGYPTDLEQIENRKQELLFREKGESGQTYAGPQDLIVDLDKSV